MKILNENLKRWQTHLESIRFDMEQENHLNDNIDNFLQIEKHKINVAMMA
jgi:predicted DNA binding CopG/RHH family protein